MSLITQLTDQATPAFPAMCRLIANTREDPGLRINAMRLFLHASPPPTKMTAKQFCAQFQPEDLRKLLAGLTHSLTLSPKVNSHMR